jgi:hypothetical protein
MKEGDNRVRQQCEWITLECTHPRMFTGAEHRKTRWETLGYKQSVTAPHSSGLEKQGQNRERIPGLDNRVRDPSGFPRWLGI